MDKKEKIENDIKLSGMDIDIMSNKRNRNANEIEHVNQTNKK